MAEQKKTHRSGLWFQAKRKQAKLTQKALADAVGVDRSYIAQIESGMRWPSKPRLYAIFAAMGVPLDVAIRELKLAPNEEADRVLRFRELLEDLAPNVKPELLRAFENMFENDQDQVRWVAQYALAEPLPAAPDGWLRLNKEDRRLVQRMVNRLLDSYPDPDAEEPTQASDATEGR